MLANLSVFLWANHLHDQLWYMPNAAPCDPLARSVQLPVILGAGRICGDRVRCAVGSCSGFAYGSVSEAQHHKHGMASETTEYIHIYLTVCGRLPGPTAVVDALDT